MLNDDTENAPEQHPLPLPLDRLYAINTGLAKTSIFPKDVTNLLKKYSTENCLLIESLLADESVIDSIYGYKAAIGKLLNNYTSEDTVADALSLRPHLDSFPSTMGSVLPQLLSALRSYRFRDMIPARTDNRVSDQVAAIMLLTYRVAEIQRSGLMTFDELPLTARDQGKVGAYVVISDAALLRLAWERPADVDRIVGVIRDRRAVDVPMITEVLDSSSPSIAEGVL